MNSIDLRDYLRPLVKWWWLLTAATLIAALSSFIYTYLQPAVYEARTTVSVGSTIKDANPTGSNVYLSQQLAEAYADIADRTPIRQNTMAALKLEWLPYYVANVLPNTPIIEFKVYDDDPNRAYVVAKELVNQLILQGPAGREEQKRQSFVEEQLAKLETSIKQTEDEITQKQEDLGKIFSAREIGSVQNQITALQNKQTTLQGNYAALLSNTQRGATNALNILEPATIPTEPTDSNLLINVLIAAMIGFALAAGGAYLIEYLDDSIKASDDMQKNLGTSLLSSIPFIANGPAGSTNSPDERLVMLQNNSVPATEAYRVLRTNLQFAMVDRALKLLLVTSPSPVEGKSLTAANLSAALARGGKRVVLVDVDLHRPTQHRLFKLINNMGLTTALLVENIPLENLLQKTTVPGLQVLATGPLPPNPAELLSSRRMQEILTKLTDYADIVVLDSPPIMAVADAVILSTIADAVLLVVRVGKTRRDAAKHALNALQQVKARVLGVVLNGVAKNAGGYYNYGYYSTGAYTLPGSVTPPTPMPKEAATQASQALLHSMPTEKIVQPSQVEPSGLPLTVKRNPLLSLKHNHYNHHPEEH
ncbi:hypothetical protein BH10CHL1_BH10CHL1_41400 [soil metagenome]